MTKLTNENSTDNKVLILQQKLDTHIENFHEYREQDEQRWNKVITAQEENTKCIHELTLSTKELTESTRDIIAAWSAANGTVKTMSALGQFVKWMSGFAFLGVFFVWLFDKLQG
jgi:hypothetical protein